MWSRLSGPRALWAPSWPRREKNQGYGWSKSPKPPWVLREAWSSGESWSHLCGAARDRWAGLGRALGECPGGLSPSLRTHLLSGHSVTSRAAERQEGRGPWGPAACRDRLRVQEPLPCCGGPSSCPSSCEPSQSTSALGTRLSAALEPRGVQATLGFRNKVRMSAGCPARAALTGLHPWNPGGSTTKGGDPGWTGASTQPRVGADRARMRCRVLAGSRDTEPPGVCAATVWGAACSTSGQK